MSEYNLNYVFMRTGPVNFTVNEKNWTLQLEYLNHNHIKEIKFPTLSQLKKFFPLIDPNLAYMMASHHFGEIEISPLRDAEIKIIDLTAG